MYYYAKKFITNIAGFLTTLTFRYFLLLIITPSLSYAAFDFSTKNKTDELKELYKDVLAHQCLTFHQPKEFITKEPTEICLPIYNTKMKLHVIEDKDNLVITVKEFEQQKANELLPSHGSTYLFIGMGQPEDTDQQPFPEHLQQTQYYQVVHLQCPQYEAALDLQEVTFHLTEVFGHNMPEEIEVNCVMFQCDLWKTSPETQHLQLDWTAIQNIQEQDKNNPMAVFPSTLYLPSPPLQDIHLLCFMEQIPDHPDIQHPSLLPCFTKKHAPNPPLVRITIKDPSNIGTPEKAYVKPTVPMPETTLTKMSFLGAIPIEDTRSPVNAGPISVDVAIMDRLQEVITASAEGESPEENTEKTYRFFPSQALMALTLKSKVRLSGEGPLFKLLKRNIKDYCRIKMRKESRPHYTHVQVSYRTNDSNNYSNPERNMPKNSLIMVPVGDENNIAEVMIKLTPKKETSSPSKTSGFGSLLCGLGKKPHKSSHSEDKSYSHNPPEEKAADASEPLPVVLLTGQSNAPQPPQREDSLLINSNVVAITQRHPNAMPVLPTSTQNTEPTQKEGEQKCSQDSSSPEPKGNPENLPLNTVVPTQQNTCTRLADDSIQAYEPSHDTKYHGDVRPKQTRIPVPTDQNRSAHPSLDG